MEIKISIKRFFILILCFSFIVITGFIKYSEVDKSVKGINDYCYIIENENTKVTKKVSYGSLDWLCLKEKVHSLQNKNMPIVYADNDSLDMSKVLINIEFNKDLENESNEIRKNRKVPIIDINNLIFVGNSLVEGLRLYSESNNQFYCKVGVSLQGLKEEIYKQIEQTNCEIVIIEMGTNELGVYSEKDFINGYLDLVSLIRNKNSESLIYCLSIPPVSENKSNSCEYFNNQNVQRYNEYIKEFCNINNLKYIDNTAFFGNVLKSNWTGDGIHLKGEIYKNWYSYIIENLYV